MSAPEIFAGIKKKKFLLTVQMSTLPYLSFLFYKCFLGGYERRESVVRFRSQYPMTLNSLGHCICVHQIYRAQRDSNPVPPSSESTTLPMAYSGATSEHSKTWRIFGERGICNSNKKL